MAITNRAMDSSEQKEALKVTSNLPVNGQDIFLGIIERPQTISDCKVTGTGVSGAPNILLKALRFVAGTGGSSFLIGSTFVFTTYATSGMMSYSLPASGSTLLNLQKGDVLLAVHGGGTGAATTVTAIEVVLTNIQDIRTWY